ncbi:esterase-like activity of phytase family protein [Paucibacter sp. KCTC 42545]|uniref:esterase-like activity of phytase family protein n=1 Tax=Paucibacter sp. KCTC 42545 TaxID=1768242 RepID=UPI000733ADAC|nr:esterase-like activity of phytase family protein [Paucibacter sp. KCTC 42545]ALT79741.1 pyruvate-binding protein [Paucibacter sp. KCTC 42545]
MSSKHALQRLASLIALGLATAAAATPAAAAISLVATGSLSGALHDLSGQSAPLENGIAGDLLGGMGSALAWAGGNTFIALPDRGPNATAWNSAIDNTASFIPRLQTVQLSLNASAGGALPYTLGAKLNATTLLYSASALNYGSAPSLSKDGKNYFTGRSDAFGAGGSLNSSNARLDPEGLRLSNDGRSVFVSDEYGPAVYQFDRATGARLKSFVLPANLGISQQNAQGALEIANNTSSGRVTNKGMEGLAITPDGKTLMGFMQSPLAQDGGDGGAANRFISIDIATGATKQFAYNNYDPITKKNYNSSEILALNDHEFLVLERDGKGLGDDSTAKFKSIYKVDLANAADVSSISGESNLLALAPAKSLFLDLKQALNAQGISDAQIPAKLEGMSFGEDIMVGGVLKHTLYIANDNDFLASSPKGLNNPNQWYVFAFSDADLNGSAFVPQQISAVPEPGSYALLLAGLMAGIPLAAARRRKAGKGH